MALQYEVWIVDNPTGTPVIRQLVSRFTPDATGAWVEFPLTELFTSSTIFDIVLIVSGDASTTSLTASWNYQSSNVAPAAGYAHHSTNGKTLVFNHDDNGTTDREAALEAIRTGDTITIGTTVWEVAKTTDGASAQTFEVLPKAQHGTKGVGSFVFKAITSSTLEYVTKSGHYSADSEVQGLLSTTGYANVATSNDGFGVDIEFQEMSVSADWDLISYSGEQTGSV
jgi:hypothetical protein